MTEKQRKWPLLMEFARIRWPCPGLGHNGISTAGMEIFHPVVNWIKPMASWDKSFHFPFSSPSRKQTLKCDAVRDQAWLRPEEGECFPGAQPGLWPLPAGGTRWNLRVKKIRGGEGVGGRGGGVSNAGKSQNPTKPQRRVWSFGTDGSPSPLLNSCQWFPRALPPHHGPPHPRHGHQRSANSAPLPWSPFSPRPRAWSWVDGGLKLCHSLSWTSA